MATIDQLEKLIAQFNLSRNWADTHTPAALASALSIEASELVACFLWKDTATQMADLRDATSKEAIEDELADVAIYLLTFTGRFQINLAASIQRKLEKNAGRFPAQ